MAHLPLRDDPSKRYAVCDMPPFGCVKDIDLLAELYFEIMQDDSSFDAALSGDEDQDMEASFQTLMCDWFHHKEGDGSDDHSDQQQKNPSHAASGPQGHPSQSYIFHDGSALKPEDIICGIGMLTNHLQDDVILRFARATTEIERNKIIAEVVKSTVGDGDQRFVVPAWSVEPSIFCRPATPNEIDDEIKSAIDSRLNRQLDPINDFVCGLHSDMTMIMMMDTALPQYGDLPGNQQLRNIIQRNDVLLYSCATSDEERNCVIERILAEVQSTLLRNKARRFVVPELLLSSESRTYYYREATLPEIKTEITTTLRTFFLVHPDPHDIICGQQGERPPLPLRNIVNPLDILRFFRESDEKGKTEIFQSIESQVHQFLGNQPMAIRFLIQGGLFGGHMHFREATPEEISAEIKDSIPMNFHFFPNQTQGIICGLGMLRNLVKRHDVLQYGRATKVEDRQKILQQIRIQLDTTAQSVCGQPLWYHVPELWLDEQQTFVCREATPAQILKEIEDGLRFHFNLSAYDNDVVSGRGEPSTKLSGNIGLRRFVIPNRHRYRLANKLEKSQLIEEAKAKVTSAGGRFLFPFDKALPTKACIEASTEYIRYKIIRMYNEVPERRTSEPCGSGRPKKKVESSGGYSV